MKALGIWLTTLVVGLHISVVSWAQSSAASKRAIPSLAPTDDDTKLKHVTDGSERGVYQVNPDTDQAVPVYNSRGRVVYNLAPGEFFGVTSDLADETLLLNAKDNLGRPVELFIKKNDAARTITTFKEARDKVFVDLPDGEKTNLTQRSGQDAVDCLIDAGSCSQEISGKTKISVDDAVLQFASDPQRPMSNSWNNFYSVKTAAGDAKGWLHAGETSVRPRETKCDICGAKQAPAIEKKKVNGVQAAVDAAVQGSMKEAAKQIGKCFAWSERSDLYRGSVLADFKKRKDSLPKFQKEDGSAMTPADWVAMDALARTVYAEMAGCFKQGLHYPKTVAKVILNRKDFVLDPKNAAQAPQFVQGKNTDFENEITRAILKPWQFSIWNEGDQAGRLAMCPPTAADKPSWKGVKPGPEELAIWEQASELAAQAIMMEKSFKNATHDMKSLFYTSNMDVGRLNKKGFHMMSRPSTGGEALNSTRCVQIWRAEDIDWKAPDVYVQWLLREAWEVSRAR